MRKKIKKGYIGAIILILLAVLITVKVQYDKKQKIIENNNKTIKKVASHYNSYVITNQITNLYDSKEKVIGKIGENVKITLEKTNISELTKYFKLTDFEEVYIEYSNVTPTDYTEKKDRYKNYIPYNQNIVTKKNTTFYDDEYQLVYQFNKSFELPIIIKDTGYYGVEYNNQLLYVNKEDIEKIVEHNNTNKINSSGVAILNYHAFYDEKNIEEAKKCTTGLCMPKSRFKEQLDYFKEIGILTITMNELQMYMDGKIQLPKSLLITIDDGGYTKIAVDMLTEYKMYATIFLITSRFDPKTYYVTDYIELHSHSHDLHNTGICPGGQGGGIKCLPKQKLLDDLKTSRELLNGTIAFCYPFYEYNEYSTNILKESGFTMAFIGEINTSYGYKLAEVNGDKYHIPRFVMFNYTTMSDLKDYLNEIK